ncbi:transporter substrate-binding domain-containing protein [Cobetia marina]|uniref:transporter substrate-binding domain-containing protein n=1 Tax=Cobetia TaxID=204286 RepID=UPI0010AE6D40|nr:MULTISPECIES: transporter substrate-binding domain-containing protein [Cobetia]MDH2292687.1 transporter substrate-binding domain-containing protein [Cobetia sp. 10Alg 146]TKD63230.1 transporter substrate-binding domain-containing protein [Cobetia marina]
MKQFATRALMGVTLGLSTLAISAGAVQAADVPDPLRLGIDVPYAPFGYKLPSGELTGFEIELGNAICEQLATRCEWVEQDFDGIIPGLMARKYDVIMSALTINPERERQVLFSAPYFTPPSGWFVKADSPLAGADSLDAEALKGKVIGVQRGNLQDHYVTDLYASVAEVRRYTKLDDLVLDMDSGRVDVAFLDLPVGQDTLVEANDGNFVNTGSAISEPKKYFGDGFGIAMKQRDRDLKKSIDEALDTLKADGTLERLNAKYFASAATANSQ